MTTSDQFIEIYLNFKSFNRSAEYRTPLVKVEMRKGRPVEIQCRMSLRHKYSRKFEVFKGLSFKATRHSDWFELIIEHSLKRMNFQDAVIVVHPNSSSGDSLKRRISRDAVIAVHPNSSLKDSLKQMIFGDAFNCFDGILASIINIFDLVGDLIQPRQFQTVRRPLKKISSSGCQFVLEGIIKIVIVVIIKINRIYQILLCCQRNYHLNRLAASNSRTRQCRPLCVPEYIVFHSQRNRRWGPQVIPGCTGPLRRNYGRPADNERIIHIS
ncbi:hypothetical protein ACOME3_003707 [Neoechinorhynchus agilis]